MATIFSCDLHFLRNVTILLHWNVRELHESDVQRSRLVFRWCVFRNPEGSMTIYLLFLSLTGAEHESKSINP